MPAVLIVDYEHHIRLLIEQMLEELEDEDRARSAAAARSRSPCRSRGRGS